MAPGLYLVVGLWIDFLFHDVTDHFYYAILYDDVWVLDDAIIGGNYLVCSIQFFSFFKSMLNDLFILLTY